MKAEEDSGVIAKYAMNINLFHLDAIQDYAPVVERDIQTNGLRC